KEAAGRQMGITSVPTFIVAGQHVVQGAQSPDLWQRVITELAEIQAAENPSNAAG
ncbi:MAG: DsbA family oxidoreductase, partial [Rhodobacteraceae bacterium]|nr:DsbA family oxidoreductase [Paracoccaceae bacterium]